MTTNGTKVLFFDVNETLLDLAEVRRSVATAPSRRRMDW
jgi:hypothetical protein